MYSDKKFHIIRDHPYHAIEILGGLWSIQNLNLGRIRFDILDYCLKNDINSYRGNDHDQNFLTHYIWPHLNMELVLVHDNFFDYNKNKHLIVVPFYIYYKPQAFNR